MARLLSGLVLGAGFFAIVWFSNATVLLAVAVAVALLAVHEYAALVRRLGAAMPRWLTLIATTAGVMVVPFPYVAGEAVVGIGVALLAIAAMASLRHPTATDLGTDASSVSAFSAPVLGVMAGGFAIIYIGLPLGALVGVHIFGGRGAVVLLIAAIAISDTAQYYSGRTLGRHPLARRISPKKTIEGAIGGFVVVPIFLYFVGPWLVPVAAPAVMAPLGLVLVAAGIAGDLFESMLKRAVDIKDSSTLIPGHGGVLDRIDGLLFATPPFYMFLRWVYTI